MRTPNRLAAAALFGIWFLAFGPMLFADVAPYYRDQLLTFIPVRHYLTERLSGLQLPQWYPYEALGVPFMGQMVTATFHPATLLLLPFDATVAAKLQTLLAYLLALVGGYKAARALPSSRPAAFAAAVAFAFGGYSLGVSHNPVYLTAHATTPFVLWAALRLSVTRAPRYAALVGVLWGLVLLAGDAQSFLVTGFIVLAAPLALRTNRAGWLLGVTAAAVAALIACIELIPALILSRDSIRVLGKTDPMLGRIFSFHPLRVFELLVPNPIPDELRVEVTTPLFHDGGALWATTIFAGSCALLCAAFAFTRPSSSTAIAGDGGRRRALVFAALALLCAWLASGAHGGLVEVLWKVFPALAQFRFPEKYLGPAWVGLSMLVALGLDAALEHRRRAAISALVLAAGLAVGALLVGALDLPARVFAMTNNGVSPALNVVSATADAWQSGALRSAGFAGLFAVVLLASVKKARLTLLLPLVVAAELMLANVRHLPMADRALINEPTEFAHTIRERAPSGARVISLAGGRALRTVTGGDPGWLVAMRHLLRADDSGRFGIGSIGFNLPATSLRAWRAFGPHASLRAQVGHLFGACFRIDDVGAPTAPPIAVQSETGLQLVANDGCRPRVYVGKVDSAADDRAAVSAVWGALIDSVWEGGPSLQGTGTATLELDEPEHMVIRVAANAPAALIVNDQFASGWTATVDGRDAPIYPTNVAVRGIPVDAGEHMVELTYQTPGLKLGAAGTFTGIFAALALLIAGRNRRLRDGSSRPS